MPPGTRRVVIVEFFDGVEPVLNIPWWTDDPTPEVLEQIAADYVSAQDRYGNGSGVATARVVERIVMFPIYPLTAEQQLAVAGLPDPEPEPEPDPSEQLAQLRLRARKHHW